MKNHQLISLGLVGIGLCLIAVSNRISSLGAESVITIQNQRQISTPTGQSLVIILDKLEEQQINLSSQQLHDLLKTNKLLSPTAELLLEKLSFAERLGDEPDQQNWKNELSDLIREQLITQSISISPS